MHRLLDEFDNAKVLLVKKISKVKPQANAVSQLEDAINKLVERIDCHKAIMSLDLPDDPLLEVKQEKMKKEAVSSVIH